MGYDFSFVSQVISFFSKTLIGAILHITGNTWSSLSALARDIFVWQLLLRVSGQWNWGPWSQRRNGSAAFSFTDAA